MQVERIEWLDSASTDRWHDPTEQDYEPIVCTTFGVVVHDDEASVAVAGSYESASQVSGVMIIPKVAIKKRTKIGTIGGK